MDNHTAVKIAGPLPDCDLCEHAWRESGGAAGRLVSAAVDGRTKWGPWAYMCEDCFQQFGSGLGLGHGQRLIVGDDR